MDHAKALAILRTLSNGIDPFSGEAFPAGSPYQHPDVVRALYAAVRVLEATHKRQTARPATAGNSGKPWAQEEDERLVAAFDAGRPLEELAVEHGRSRLAIEARLARFGKVPIPAGVRVAAVQAREPMRAPYAFHAGDGR
jgi:hypothetical protein